MPIRFSSKSLPLALLATCVLTFGLLIPTLGFYQDDWHPVYYGYARGLSSLWELFYYDSRPFAATIFVLGFRLIGFKPLNWHLLALALRGLTVLFTWLCLRDLWPERRRESAWAALLFAVYPLFKLQPLALIYSIHWTGFLLFAVSIWAMLQSLRKPHQFWLFTALALLTQGLHLVLLEYYAGLELARPLLLWLLLQDKQPARGERFKKAARLWAPYLLVLAAFAIYRVFLIPEPARGSVGNDPTVIFDFLKAPLPAALRILQAALQDTTAILFTAWQNVFAPARFAFTQPANLIAILASLASAAALFVYLNGLRFAGEAKVGSQASWARPALLLGLALTVLGPLPAWLSDQSITSDNPLWSDRYGLASMIGASLVVVALLEGLVSDQRYRTAIFCLLVGFSIGWQLFNGNEFRRAWIKQANFYWQLTWRAPSIQPGTAIFSDGEIFPYMGEYPTSFALGALYPKFENTRDLPYYFFSLRKHYDEQRDDLVRGLPLRQVAYSSLFLGNSRDSLVIFYEPENYECLWVLGPEGSDIRALPEIPREVVAASNLARIQPGSPSARSMPTEIFGAEPGPTWCYYFEKADLARQQGDWPRVVALWEQAAENGFSPGNGVEYLPFIEGFAHMGEWEMATEMTFQSEGSGRVMAPALCAAWQRIETSTPASDLSDETLEQVYAGLQCPSQ